MPGSKTAFFVFKIARGAHVREALTILLRSRVDFFVVKIARGADCRIDIIMVIFLQCLRRHMEALSGGARNSLFVFKPSKCCCPKEYMPWFP